MWVRAVWKEGSHEQEGAIPRCWIKDDSVLWPPGANATKAYNEMKEPTGSWRRFPLVKIKITSSEFTGITNHLLVDSHHIRSHHFCLIHNVYLHSGNKEECETYEATTSAELSDHEHATGRRMPKKRRLSDYITGMCIRVFALYT